jgi:3-hydroxyacyl-[acyl-carrier-protein] dehydratase
MTTTAAGTGLDLIVDVEPGIAARGVRNVPSTLDVFETHFPRFPVLPGVLILDTLAELGGLAGGPGRWRLAGASRVQFRHFVQPGDQMLLDVEVVRHEDPELVMRGAVHVDGRLVARVRELRLRDEWAGSGA